MARALHIITTEIHTVDYFRAQYTSHNYDRFRFLLAGDRVSADIEAVRAELAASYVARAADAQEESE